MEEPGDLQQVGERAHRRVQSLNVDELVEEHGVELFAPPGLGQRQGQEDARPQAALDRGSADGVVANHPDFHRPQHAELRTELVDSPVDLSRKRFHRRCQTPPPPRGSKRMEGQETEHANAPQHEQHGAERHGGTGRRRRDGAAGRYRRACGNRTRSGCLGTLARRKALHGRSVRHRRQRSGRRAREGSRQRAPGRRQPGRYCEPQQDHEPHDSADSRGQRPQEEEGRRDNRHEHRELDADVEHGGKPLPGEHFAQDSSSFASASASASSCRRKKATSSGLRSSRSARCR